MGTFEGQAGIMREALGGWPDASSPPTVGAPALRPRALAALLLGAALALGAALFVGINARHSSSPAAAVHRHRSLARAGLLSLPRAAQGPVSATVGADSPAYRLTSAPGGFRAANPVQQLHSTFTRTGVSVATGATRVGLSLRGVGYGSELTTLARVAPRADGNRVLYAYPGLSESYANGPLGLEQWFTIAKGPGGRAAGRAGATLTLSVALSGDAQASLSPDRQSIALRDAGKTVLRYSGLAARDARGRVLHSWLALDGERLLVRVDAAGARYPLRIDPLIQQGAKLTGAGETAEGELGFQVALSANGDTALIGAPGDNDHVGAAWVFTRSGSTWSQQGGKLTGAGEVEKGEFGFSVALSADGDTALIGGDRDHIFLGAAWVFTRSGEKWSQQGGKLTGGEEEPSPSGDFFGFSVALSSEGNTALIGSYADTGEKGAAWVFTRSGEKWSQQGKKLTGVGQVGEADFGYALALSADGDTALIGAPIEGIDEVGSVYVFTRSGTKWTQQGGKVTGSEEVSENPYFGISVALSANGNTALIGGRGDSTNIGAAWVFTRTGETWTQQGSKITGSGEKGEGHFGNSVALSSEGNIALIGGENDVKAVGSAWVFTRAGETWTQQGSKITGSGESGEGRFGDGVALSAEGNTALIGGPSDNGELGAAWVFVSGPTVVTGSASEVTPASAAVSGMVNPNEEATTCKFEYGTTVSYGKTASCTSSPGSGATPVAVSAALTSLSADTTYHFRISATNERGTNTGGDETFTTLATSASAETKEEKKPAEATDGKLSVKASGGTGKITVGPYGEDIGGGALPKSAGKYIDVYRAAASKFATIEIKDCELGGGKTIWWDNPATTWEPILEPPAAYTEGAPPCITLTLTESTKPSVAQLTGTRFGTRFGELPGPLEYGECVATKGGFYEEGMCLKPDAKNKGNKFKGKFEWHASPVGCYAKKDGRYSNSGCTTLDVKNGKPKGKFETGGSPTFQGTGGTAKFEIESVGTLECKTSASAGTVTGQKTGKDTITYQGCALVKNECASQGEAPGTIQTFPLETFIEDEGDAVDTEVFQDPVMTFTCGAETYTLQGGFRGETTGGVNVMSLTSESVFAHGVGEQELETSAGGKEHKTTVTATYPITRAHEMEISTSPKGTGT